jgi:Carbohydrate-selective porin, OprB family/S-layer homology domain
MSYKVLWNSLLATPALIGAALIVSSSAIAAEVQPSTEADALLGDVTSLEVAPVAVPAQISAMPAAEVAPTAELTSVTSVDALAEIAPVVEAPAQLAQAAPVEAAPAVPAVEVAPAAAPSVDSLNQVIQYSNEGNSGLAQAGGLTIDRLSDVRPSDWAYTALQNLVEKYACIVGYPNLTYQGNRALTRYEFAAGLSSCLDRISDLIAASTADLATKEDLATLQRLQEEFAAELATLRGRVDSLEARTAELEANQFSTTTKLKGETIFLVGVPFDEDDQFDDQPNFGYRVRLNFDTSFTGDDLLRARLQARNIDEYDGFGGLDWKIGSGDSNNVTLSKLYYTFPLGDSIDVTLAANGFSDSDWVASSISPLDDDGQGALSSFGSPTPYNFIPGSAGAGAIIQLADNLSFDFGYSAAEAQRSDPGAGLFNGDYGIVAQLTYLSDFLDAALVYANSYSGGGFTDAAAGPAVANTYGALFNFKFGKFEVGGNAAYTPIIDIGNGSYDVWSYQATLAIRDLGGRGNMLGLLAGVAPYDSDLAFGLDDDNSFVGELFYRLRLSDNISVTPGVIYIDSPGNNSANDATFVGAIRTTFSF